jgi:hypothetical protein
MFRDGCPLCRCTKLEQKIFFFPVSLNQILQELPNLTDQEREELLERLLEWNETSEIEETPELLAAIDEGTWSAENEPMSTLEDVKKRLEEKWGWKLD